MSTTTKSVVVLGGGFAGVAVAGVLSGKLDPARYSLTLISDRPFFIHYPATARLTVSDQNNLGNTPFIPYDHLFKANGKFKLGTATAIEKHEHGGEVVLKDGTKVAFDVLILATGNKWEGALDFPETDEEIQEWLKLHRGRVTAAKEIVLVGGGAVGSETSGEIIDVYPDKKVTIVHGGAQLLNSAYPDKFRAALERSIRARGVEIVFNEYIDEIPQAGVTEVTTRSGKKIHADLVIVTRGPRPNTGLLSALGEDTLTKTGHVKVKPSLQLSSHPDIFAIGDIIDWPEQKQAGKVYGEVGIVAANVLSVLEGREPKSVYKGGFEIIAISNGKADGLTYFPFLWGLIFGAWFTRPIKSAGLMVSLSRSKLGF